MGKTTEYLGLYEAADNDFYNVEKDQNENFTILDNKAKEVDEALLSAKGYTDGLATSKTINSFPLSRATEGEVYRVPTTNKYVICTKNYSGGLISLPNSNFEELSVKSNVVEVERSGDFTLFRCGVLGIVTGPFVTGVNEVARTKVPFDISLLNATANSQHSGTVDVLISITVYCERTTLVIRSEVSRTSSFGSGTVKGHFIALGLLR